MSEKTLVLPVDLKERRELLENELRNTISEQISLDLTNDVNGLFKQYGITGDLVTISWEFHPESDDEGGTDWYPSYITLSVDGEEIEMKKKVINKKSTWSDSYYDYSLDEEINELICDWRDDLHKHDVESLLVRIGE
jgi:hypothetical protein